MKAIVKLTRLEQTLFGLPFILAGTALACMQTSSFPWKCILCILPAFLMARCAGMAFNQLIDREIDKKNPRTQDRLLASGRLPVQYARFIAWSCLFLFLILAAQINRFCLILAPLAAGLIYFYSYTKRFTWACHFVLGSIHFLAPVMAYGAIVGRADLLPCLLGSGAFFLISGNDILYAMQDYHFDCSCKISSIPAQFGLKNSHMIAVFLHLLSIFALIGAGIAGQFVWPYWISIASFALFLVLGRLLKPVEKAFFISTFGASASVLIGIAGGVS